MDVLRKELNAFYESQKLDEEVLDYAILDKCRQNVEVAADVEQDCRVITDAASDRCYIYGRSFPALIGLTKEVLFLQEMNSSDEDDIYERIHPEDLVEKRMLEYDFFTFINTVAPENKLDYKATCHLRMRNLSREYIYVDNSTRILRLSPKNKVWLILCCYAVSPFQDSSHGILPRIVDLRNGEVTEVSFSGRRENILTQREKEILNYIRRGMLSKEIASKLNISVHTVNRHRQNILQKLSVDNSMEAVMAASMMKLF